MVLVRENNMCVIFLRFLQRVRSAEFDQDFGINSASHERKRSDKMKVKTLVITNRVKQFPRSITKRLDLDQSTQCTGSAFYFRPGGCEFESLTRDVEQGCRLCMPLISCTDLMEPGLPCESL